MKKYLIVVDMQRDFIDGVLGTPEAQAIVPKVVEKVKNFTGDHIFFTFDTHTSDERSNFLETVEGQHIPTHCQFDEDGWRLPKELEELLESFPETSYTTLLKSTFGFNVWGHWLGEFDSYRGKLECHTNKMDITIIGLCTDICVITNALILRSLFPCANITVDSSCCAGTTPEAHTAALQAMYNCYIDII